MASPTEAEIQDQLSNSIHLFETFREFAHENAQNYLGQEDTFIQSLETDYADAWLAAVGALRGSLNGVITQAAAVMTPGLLTYGKFLDTPEADAQTIITRLYDDFVDNAKTVASRQFTFGTPPAPTGTGDGIINRLNTDADGFDIENQTADIKTAECTQDEHTGAQRHEEIFQFRGGAPNRQGELLNITGSGKLGSVKALSGVDSLRFIGNPSFSNFSGSSPAAPTAITDWTETTAIANFQIDQANTYRDFNGDTTPAAVLFEDNDTLTQSFSLRRVQVNPFVPMYFQIAINRNSTGVDGTITITVGGISEAVDLTTLPASGYTVFRVVIGTKNWHKNFNTSNPVISIALSGRTTGAVLIDDVIFAPYTNFDGSWYAIVGGETKFLVDDIATWTDTEIGSVLQVWFFRAFGRYLPHTSGAATWLDP